MLSLVAIVIVIFPLLDRDEDIGPLRSYKNAKKCMVDREVIFLGDDT
jgi:hypothetical protein